MTAQLHLRINKYLDGDAGGETLHEGAMVEVRSLFERGGTRVRQRLAVPVTEDASRSITVTVDPGRYEVSAVLPSGSVISRIVDVTGDDADVDAALDAGYSPHEWLSWQQWSGNIAPVRSGKGRAPAARQVPHVSGEYDIRLFRVPAAGGLPDPLWGRLAARLALPDAPDAISPSEILPPGVIDQPVDVMDDPPYTAIRLRRGAGGHAERAYLNVTRHDNQSMLCAMPWPWQQSDMSGEAVVEAVVTTGTQEAGEVEWSVRTTVRDHRLVSMLSYFSVGEQRTARDMAATARHMLFGKQVNPLAAAAGAYVLVGEWINESARGTTQQDWMKWVRNLSDWFPWLPDGAILKGWLALRMRGREPLLDEARAALLEAERRGIPLFSAGVRRLVDGLMLIAGEYRTRGEAAADVDAALARARQLAWQVDPAQPFTCVRLWTS